MSIGDSKIISWLGLIPGDALSIRPPVGEQWKIIKIACNRTYGVNPFRVPDLELFYTDPAAHLFQIINYDSNCIFWSRLSIYIDHDYWLLLRNHSAGNADLAAMGVQLV